MNWGSKEEFTVWVSLRGTVNFWPRCYTKKVLWPRCQIYAQKLAIASVSTRNCFSTVIEYFFQIEPEGLRRSFTVWVFWGGKNFWPRCYTKKVLYTLSNLCSKTRYIVFQHKLLFNGQGLFQMNWGSKEECHCLSTVWGGNNFWPRCYTKKVLWLRCQISRSKTRHSECFNINCFSTWS